MTKPRRKVFDFVRARQGEGQTPDQLEREMREAMKLVYSDYRLSPYGHWFRDTVCPTCGSDIDTWARRCQIKGHKDKPILRREYAELSSSHFSTADEGEKPEPADADGWGPLEKRDENRRNTPMNRCIAKSLSARGNRCPLNARYAVIRMTVMGWVETSVPTVEQGPPQWCWRHAQVECRRRNAEVDVAMKQEAAHE